MRCRIGANANSKEVSECEQVGWMMRSHEAIKRLPLTHYIVKGSSEACTQAEFIAL